MDRNRLFSTSMICYSVEIDISGSATRTN
uniref:Uncharacterized protein n=1 Tax=Arundo donax TaxID=35708 RepID=A0A0A8YIL4_ARUDO